MPEEHSGTWNIVGDRYVRIVKLYDLTWNGNLSALHPVAAPFGGPVAVPPTLQKKDETDAHTKCITIYSASGARISDIEWDSSPIHIMGWTAEENLCVLGSDGTLRIISMYGDEILAPRRICQDTISLARIFAQGVVIITNKNELCVGLLLTGTINEMVVLSHTLNFVAECFDVVPADLARSDCVEILIASTEQRGNLTIATVSERSIKVAETKSYPGNVRDLVVSNDGKYVAIYTIDRGLCVWTADFRVNMAEFDFGGDLAEVVPHQILWADKDIIVLVLLAEQFEGEMFTTFLMVDIGNTGDSAHAHIRLDTLDPIADDTNQFVVCATECDGIRVITQNTSHFIQTVPQCIQDIYRMTSTEPSALLCGAFEAYSQKNPSSVHCIRDLSRKRIEEEDCTALEKAVEDCIEAAGQEIDVKYQKRALRVAAYGKCFCRNFDAELFVDMCRTIRVLNAVRMPHIGIPLTLNQFRGLEIQVLVDRLINRRLHLLAFQICQYLGRKVDKVLVHWACLKVSSGRESDDEIRTQITAKLQQCPGVSYAKVASTAYKAGRSALAITLLNEEPKAAEQVPLLLEMNQPNLALSKAVDSNDADLIHSVLMMMRRLAKGEVKSFLRTIAEQPVAFKLYTQLMSIIEPNALLQYYEETNQQQHIGLDLLTKAYCDSGANLKAMRNVKDGWDAVVSKTMEQYTKIESMFAGKKDLEFYSKSLRQEVALLSEQRSLARETSRIDLVGSSAAYTIQVCFEVGNDKRAEHLRTKFGITEKKMWWCRLKGLCEARDWDAVDQMGGVGKTPVRVRSPIGFFPFIEELIKRGRNEQARKFVSLLPDITDRLEQWVRLGDIPSAIQDARKEESVELLEQLKARTSNATHHMEIDKHIAALS